MQYVQYGCGLDAPEGWLNFDASPSLRIQRIPLVGRFATKVRFPKEVRFGDIVKGLPLPDGSADGVYCSHILEHLAVADMRKALLNTWRLLKVGGIFRLLVPDLRVLAEQYMAVRTAEESMAFVYFLRMGDEVRPKGLRAFIRGWLGNEKHRWNWDYESMEREVQTAGFKSVRRAQYGDCKDPRFNNVENPERWIRSLGVECIKT